MHLEWGSNLQPKHVPDLGIELGTFWSQDDTSTNSAILTSAVGPGFKYSHHSPLSSGGEQG